MRQRPEMESVGGRRGGGKQRQGSVVTQAPEERPGSPELWLGVGAQWTTAGPEAKTMKKHVVRISFKPADTYMYACG